ncbi:MAG: bifunctional (p)ppGpp synthetase/guanosine-3',5'-bis(diphosphate) 3'-pyrophosphohydrolase, partial [Clostridia bacterium]|nr:bifunctional (p)ppGpp synthetase/guanosine-3',5'-bis(diphosphate) 3'-pyrophosphohydrolase [Clostridia bacterium]
SKDIRVIIIKLCDRLHNMRTLSVKREEKQRATALETMQIYAPLAHRLGMQKVKHELENLSLRYLDPPGYKEVEEGVAEHYGHHTDFIGNARAEMAEKLAEYGISYHIEGRIKSIYSVYRKMYNQGKSLDEIFDFYALRVIVDTELECYTVLGIVHEMYKSIPGRFKDYISTPKPNMYQSLHTTVIGREGVPFEVQIRTWKMHQIADYGVAAHWKYKTGSGGQSAQTDQKLEWISRLIETESTDPDELIRALKTDIYQEEVYVFTPKGDVITLPQGSTVIDFAYSIHSAVGNRMVGAKINGMIVPIDKVPQNGDIIEIITSQSTKGPSRDWLSIVKTSEARNKIRQWFKKEKRAENIDLGISMLESELRKFGRAVSATVRDEIVVALAERIGMTSKDDLYNAIGYGGVSISKISVKLRDEYDKRVKPLEEAPPVPAEQLIQQGKKRRIASGGILIDGDVDCQVKFAKCCNPLPGDPIIGFITKGYGISIHKKDCPNVQVNMREENKDRFVRADWDTAPSKSAENGYEALMSIHATNSLSLLANITTALLDMHVTLSSISTQARQNGQIIVNLTVLCKNLDHYYSIVSRLKGLKDVDNVTRGYYS